jgi:transcription elongation factor GreB
MSRYRPPAAKSSPYITAEGAAKLRQELRQLWKVERPQVTQIVHEAAKNGDRSENGDYIYGKRRLGEIDRRVRYLSKRLETATIVDKKPRETSRVFFAAFVTLEDQDDPTAPILQYRLVGADEIDGSQNWISIDSPMARALIGKGIDDEVQVQTPEGDRNFVITAIAY